MRGQLGEKLIGAVIREVAESGGDGLLRVSCGEVKKALFFETGVPVFAISSLPHEQLEHKLAEDQILDEALVQALLGNLPNKQQLGSVLVKSGLLTEERLQEVTRDLVLQIIMSLFEWDRGDYVFDEKLKAKHETTIDFSAAEVILLGSRRAAEIEELATAIAPLDRTIAQASPEAMAFGCTAKLTPIESYVMSRIDSPTPIAEAATYTGLSEEEARKAVCVLVSLGLLVLTGEVKETASRKRSDSQMRKLNDEVARRLHSLSSADYYEILGVTNLATTGEVETAFNRVTKKLDPAQYPQPEYAELRAKMGVLLDKINEAYDTLSNIKKRREYDENKMRSSLELHKKQRPAQPKPQRLNASQTPRVASASARVPAPANHGSSLDPPITPPQGPAPNKAPQLNNPTEAAEYYYKLGRARYEQRDCHAAVQLLREAVKLDASRPHYHYFLGIALSVVSQARHDKHHDGCHVTCKLGRVLVSNPRLRREAEQHLLTAAELDPSSAQIRLRLGYLYKDAELPKRAEHYFREALLIDPTNQAALKELEIVEK